jgi:2-polyprenyl-6-methoxyphenol hydroxylase-like FAD-dependent oxidoreductase
MNRIPRILVSGGGIAGNAVALQLARAGVPVTIVERAQAPRPGGQAVDLRGASREAAERMGLMPGIRRHQLDERGMAYVDAAGRVYGRMAMEDFEGKGAVAEIEITRGDLNGVLLEALQDHADAVDIRYGDRLLALAQDETGVEASFASGGRERFDLVIGADGVHSATRALAFGSEDTYLRNLGGYAAFFTMPAPADVRPGWFTMRLIPGAMFGLRPDADPATAMAIINIRTPRDAALRGDRAAQEALIRRAIEDGGWHAPGILDAMTRAEDFYFDELARVDMPSLVSNRVVLIGDAGTCGSPLTGMGTAMALVAAYLLGREIAEVAASSDAGMDDAAALADALARFERDLAPHLERSRQIPGGSLAVMIPRTRVMTAASRLNVRILLSRVMRPLAKRMFADDGSAIPLPETLTAPAGQTVR